MTSSLVNFWGIFDIEKIVLFSGIVYWTSFFSFENEKNSQYFEKISIKFFSEFNKEYFDISFWANKSFNLILNCSLVIELILLVSKLSGAIYGYN